MTEEQKTDWSKIAAWTFGVWAAMLPLSAAVIGYYQRQTIERQDVIRAEIAALRIEMLRANAVIHEDLQTVHERQDRNTKLIDDHELRLRVEEKRP